MQPGAERAPVVRAPRHEGEPRAEPLRDRERDVCGERVLGEPLPGDHDGVRAGLAQRGGDAPLEGLGPVVAVVDPLEHVRLVLGPAELVLGDVGSRVVRGWITKTFAPPAGGLADPEVQDRQLLLGVEPGDTITFARSTSA